MSSRTTVVRSLRDLGAAAWFGGSLMGAGGVNGAAGTVRDWQDRARVAANTLVKIVLPGAIVMLGAQRAVEVRRDHLRDNSS